MNMLYLTITVSYLGNDIMKNGIQEVLLRIHNMKN